MMDLTAVSPQELSDWLSSTNVDDHKEVEEETASILASSSYFLIPTPITYSSTPTQSPTPPQSSSLSSESSSLLPWDSSQNHPSCESRPRQHRHQQQRRSSFDDEDANVCFGIDEFTMLMTTITDDSNKTNKTNTGSQGANLVSDAAPLSSPDCSIQSRDSVNRDSVLSQMKQLQQPILQQPQQQSQTVPIYNNNNNSNFHPLVVSHQQLQGYGNCITPSTDAVVSSSSASSSSSLIPVNVLQNIRVPPFQVQERAPAPVVAAAIGGNCNGSSPTLIQHCRSLSLPENTTSNNNIPSQSHSSSGGINSSASHHHHHPPALQRTSSMPITPSSNNLHHRRRISALSLLSAMEQTQLSQEFIGRASSAPATTTPLSSSCTNTTNNFHSSRGISMMNDTTKSRVMLLTMLKSNGGGGSAAVDNGTRGHGHLSRRATVNFNSVDNNGHKTKQPPFPSYSHHFRNRRATAGGGTRPAQNHGNNFTKNPIVKRGNEFDDPEESAIQAELQRIAQDQMAKMKKS